MASTYLTSVAGPMGQQTHIPGGGNMLNYTPLPGSFGGNYGPVTGGSRRRHGRGRTRRSKSRTRRYRRGGQCPCSKSGGKSSRVNKVGGKKKRKSRRRKYGGTGVDI